MNLFFACFITKLINSIYSNILLSVFFPIKITKKEQYCSFRQNLPVKFLPKFNQVKSTESIFKKLNVHIFLYYMIV